MKNIFLALVLFSSSLCFGEEPPMDVLISSEEIASRVEEVARIIERDYEGKHLTVMIILKGSICIASDLIRQLHIPFKLECIRASSYSGMHGGGELCISLLDHLDLQGRDILIVDDIFDTGNTMRGVCREVAKKDPSSIKTLTLLAKNTGKPAVFSRPDYVLFDIPNRFVIGYGLDYNELFRGLPNICAFVGDKAPF